MQWRDEAETIYNESMCRGAGCCGNVEGALEYLAAKYETVIADQEDKISFLRDQISDLKERGIGEGT
jgi:hypothetical protein